MCVRDNLYLISGVTSSNEYFSKIDIFDTNKDNVREKKLLAKMEENLLIKYNVFY